MKHFSSLLIICLLMASSAFAQYQLPDPGFEDWSGETFDNAIQPRYWNYCNVVQFGFNFNFSDKFSFIFLN